MNLFDLMEKNDAVQGAKFGTRLRRVASVQTAPFQVLVQDLLEIIKCFIKTSVQETVPKVLILRIFITMKIIISSAVLKELATVMIPIAVLCNVIVMTIIIIHISFEI